MAGKSKYTTQQKREALRLLRDPALSYYEVRDQTGISVGTLHKWASDAKIKRSGSTTTQEATERRRQRLQEKREALAETLLDRAADLEARMDEPHIDFRGKDSAKVTFPQATSSDVRNYAVALAVLLDKFRLEMGEPTSYQEVISAPRDRLSETVDELAGKRDRKAG